jgi:hypothetical protein
MSGRGRASFEKRRKEQARKEKRLQKAERRAQRVTGVFSPNNPDSIQALESEPAAPPGSDQGTEQA